MKCKFSVDGILSGHSIASSAIHVAGLAQLLQDLVSVCPEVQVLLEEVPAPVGEHFLRRLLLLVFIKVGARLVVVAGGETRGDDAGVYR